MSTAVTVAPVNPLDRRAKRSSGDLTLDLARTVMTWHGVRPGRRQALCTHCMPDTAWPCGPWTLAKSVLDSLTRNEPYGPLEDNPYLAELARADLGRPGL